MNQQDGELCVRVLSCVAWADGSLSEEEMAAVVDVVDRLDYVDRSTIQDILMATTRFTFLDKVTALDRKVRIRLLHDCYTVADYCGGVTDAEREIIRSLAVSIVDPKKLPDAEAALEAWVAYEAKARKVFGWTHLAD
jgi:uncharacterized tellurite resistance protein B-like protein